MAGQLPHRWGLRVEDGKECAATGLGEESEAAKELDEVQLVATVVEDVSELDDEGGPWPLRRIRWRGSRGY
jgi:hypothetical protein